MSQYKDTSINIKHSSYKKDNHYTHNNKSNFDISKYKNTKLHVKKRIPLKL